MPPSLPDSLAKLLSLLRPAFTAPSFDTFCWLVHGFIGRIGEHTITGIWQAARLAGVYHHSRAHEFFARRRWSADELGLRLAEFVVERFVPCGAPIGVAIDDTLFPRSGERVFGASWHYDADAKSGRRLRFGNTFVCLGILVELPGLGERTFCLPLLFRLWRPAPEGTAQQTKVEFAHALLGRFAERFSERRVELVADGLYAGKSLRGLPENASACVRLRSNAALHALPTKRAGQLGRPRKRGERLGTPAEIARTAKTGWKRVEAGRRPARVEVLTLDCLWYRSLGELVVRVVIVRDRKRGGLDIAILCTDREASAAEVLRRYAARWAIEVAFQEAKGRLGVGEARNRVRRAVERTVPFGFLCQSLALIWYALHGEPGVDVARHRREAPWYLQKRAPSFSARLPLPTCSLPCATS